MINRQDFYDRVRRSRQSGITFEHGEPVLRATTEEMRAKAAAWFKRRAALRKVFALHMAVMALALAIEDDG